MIRYLFRLLASFFTRAFAFFISVVVFLIRQFVLFIRQLVFFVKQLVFFLIRQLKSLYRQLVFFIKQLVSFLIRQLNFLVTKVPKSLVPFIAEKFGPFLLERSLPFFIGAGITAGTTIPYYEFRDDSKVLTKIEALLRKIDTISGTVNRTEDTVEGILANITSTLNITAENQIVIRSISANISSISDITAKNEIAIRNISVKIDSISNTTARNERAIGDISADISSVSNYVVNNINKTLAFAIHTKTVEIDQMNQTINQIMSQAKDQGKKMYRSNQEKYQEYIDALLKRQGQLEKEGKELRQKRDEFLKDPLKPLNMYNNDPDEIASSSNSIEEFNRAQDKFIVYITDPKTKNLPKAIPLIVNNRAVLLNRAVPVRREMGKMSSSSSSCPSRGQGIFLGELLDPKTRNPFSIYNSNQPFFLNNGIGLNNRCFLYLP